MAAFETFLRRRGYVRLDRYGLLLTPEDRVLSTRAEVLDDGLGGKVVGWLDGDLAPMELRRWGATCLAAASPVAANVRLQPAPVPAVSCAPAVAAEPAVEEDEWEWEIAIARARVAAEAQYQMTSSSSPGARPHATSWDDATELSPPPVVAPPTRSLAPRRARPTTGPVASASPRVTLPAPVTPRVTPLAPVTPRVTPPAPVMPRAQVTPPAPVMPRAQVTPRGPVMPRAQVTLPPPVIPRALVAPPAPVMPGPLTAKAAPPSSVSRPTTIIPIPALPVAARPADVRPASYTRMAPVRTRLARGTWQGETVASRPNAAPDAGERTSPGITLPHGAERSGGAASRRVAAPTR